MMKRISIWFVLAMMVSLALASTSFAQETITPGTPIEGEYAGEAQVYNLEAVRGQLLLITMNSNELDSVVGIGQGGEEFASDDDSNGDDNSLLAYVVKADGTYEVTARASFWSEGDEGAYTLNVEVVDPTIAEYGVPVTLTPEGEETRFVYTVFEAAADDVVHVWVETTDNSSDSSLYASLVGVDGEEIENDDSDWHDNNALIRRVVLPEAGLYLVRVRESNSRNFLTIPAQVMVEQTERLFLTAEPQELVLGDAEGQKGTEVYFIDAEAGVTYRFTVTIPPFPDDDGGIEMELLDTAFFFAPSIETLHSVGLVWDYTAQSSRQIRLDVHPNFFGRDISRIDYTIAMEIIE